MGFPKLMVFSGGPQNNLDDSGYFGGLHNKDALGYLGVSRHHLKP